MRTAQQVAEDAQILESAKSGQAGAMEDLINKYDKMIREILYKKLNIQEGHSDFEAIYSAAIEQLWQALPRYDPEKASPNTWVYTVLHNRIMNEWRNINLPWRSIKEVPTSFELHDDPEDESGVPRGSIQPTLLDIGLESGEMTEEIDSLLERLPAQMEDIARRYFGLGRPQQNLDEIAQDLGYAHKGTISKILKKAIETLETFPEMEELFYGMHRIEMRKVAAIFRDEVVRPRFSAGDLFVM